MEKFFTNLLAAHTLIGSVGCSTAGISQVSYEYRCPEVQWIEKGANRPLDRVDEITLNNAKEHCSKKTNGNVCVIYIERKPKYDYYALCGKKGKYEVK